MSNENKVNIIILKKLKIFMKFMYYAILNERWLKQAKNYDKSKIIQLYFIKINSNITKISYLNAG